MFVETISQGFQRIRRTNATDNGFPSRLFQVAEPSGIGDSAAQATASAVFDLAGRCPTLGNVVQNGFVLKFYGAGANNATFSVRVIGWRQVMEGGDLNTAGWDPTDLCELACTLSSTPVGLAGRIITATDLFADTIAITGTTANAGVSIDVISPANDRAAHVMLDVKGFQKVEIIFTTGGSATSCNGLIAQI